MSQPLLDSPLFDTTELTSAEFDEMRALIFDTFGVSLSDQKRSLIEGRLRPVLARENLPSFRDYIDKVKSDGSRKLLSELVNRISTNHTYFNRESAHFDFFLKASIPEAMARPENRRKRQVRVWCAASSTGQEPYTLALLLAKGMGADHSVWDSGVLATDINTEVLEFANRGIYEPSDAEKLPAELLSSGFRKMPDGRYEVRASVKKQVTYRRFNLMTPAFPFKTKFDVVFCRNVMIYFNEETKASLCRRIAGQMIPGGHLFVGAAESIPTDPLSFRNIAPGVYRRT